ncbi:MAG: hypothetical protein ACI3ZP_05985 [Candidatus Cryptobacteroides sp.]
MATLYSGNDGEESLSDEVLRSRASSGHPLLNAVPSDAALVFTGRSLGRGVSIAADSCYIFGKVLSGDSEPFREFLTMVDSYSSANSLGPLRNASFCISLHFSGKAVPLLCFRVGKSIEDIPAEADSIRVIGERKSVYVAFKQVQHSEESSFEGTCLMLASPSESLVHSAERHIDNQSSILDTKEFASISSRIEGDYRLFFDHNYSMRLANTLLSGECRNNARFLNNYSSWSGIAAEKLEDGRASLAGASFSSGSASDYVNVLSGLQPGQPGAFSFFPDCSAWVSTLTLPSYGDYSKAYRTYLDASGGLKDYKYLCTVKKRKYGSNPESWADSVGIREVAVAGVPVGDSLSRTVALRVSNPTSELVFSGDVNTKKYNGEILPSKFASYPGILLGNLFVPSDTLALITDGWVVFGNEAALSLFKREKDFRSVSDFMTECGATDIFRKDGAVFTSYFAMTGDRALSYFSEGLAANAVKAVSGITFSPVLFSLYSGPEHRFRLDVGRVRSTFAGSNLNAMLKDTVIVVPKGPFTVRNCGTGKQNKLSQNKNNYLVLSEMNGKSLWGVPLKAPVCGAIAEVDYFNNGKIQFLLAAGDELLLIDRLGRYVRPFPVKLQEKILLGPAVHDTGDGKTVVLIHPGNRIGMYSLEGKPRSWWKGISLNETVKQLPELISSAGVSYWLARTSEAAYIFPFEGGEPLSPLTGDKRLRPDATVTAVKDGIVSAVCLDGKERNIKLTK